MRHDHQEILTFWFETLSQSDWFKKDASLDEIIKRRFYNHLIEASRGELHYWRVSPQGRLAEIIVLDQFGRNIYRESPRAFENDVLALVLAQEVVRGGHDLNLSPLERSFAYMPYMHSESRMIHEDALKLFTALGLEESLKFEEMHKEIIDRFGRYPHRNKVLGRNSTQEEINFLEHHSGF